MYKLRKMLDLMKILMLLVLKGVPRHKVSSERKYLILRFPISSSSNFCIHSPRTLREESVEETSEWNSVPFVLSGLTV